MKRWRACAKAGSQGLSAKIPGFLGAGQTNANGTQQNSRAPLYLRFTSIGCQEEVADKTLQGAKTGRQRAETQHKIATTLSEIWVGKITCKTSVIIFDLSRLVFQDRRRSRFLSSAIHQDSGRKCSCHLFGGVLLFHVDETQRHFRSSFFAQHAFRCGALMRNVWAAPECLDGRHLCSSETLTVGGGPARFAQVQPLPVACILLPVVASGSGCIHPVNMQIQAGCHQI